MAVSSESEANTMTKQEAMTTLMEVTQEAMKLYGENHPNWLRDFESTKNARLAWINEYVMHHTTPELRAAIK